jgi:hypothetical protein
MENMLVNEFLDTIYLGDRACKAITIDGWGRRVLVQVDEISRVRSASGLWEYYNDENIVDGLIVFSEVRSIVLDPPGPIPNDFINDFEAEILPDDYYRITLWVSSGDEHFKSTEVSITIEAKRVHLEDPIAPGVAIEN